TLRSTDLEANVLRSRTPWNFVPAGPRTASRSDASSAAAGRSLNVTVTGPAGSSASASRSTRAPSGYTVTADGRETISRSSGGVAAPPVSTAAAPIAAVNVPRLNQPVNPVNMFLPPVGRL